CAFEIGTPPPPTNNDCANATELTVVQGDGATCINTIGTNISATASGATPNPTCSQFGSGEDVWYSVTVPLSGDVSVEMSSAGGPNDWAMSIYSGSCGSLAEVECDDDDGPGFFPLIELTGRTPGEILLVRVFEFNNNEIGPFNICAFADQLLPVEMVFFNGKAVEAGNLLTWQTASESENEGFEIQRSENAKDFKTIDFMAGKGTTLEQQNYTFLDATPIVGTSYYRLKQMDFDGKFEYSKVVTIQSETKTANRFQAFPNPTSDLLTFSTTIERVDLFDWQGRLLKTQINPSGSMSLATYPSGMYMLVMHAEGQQERQLIVKE
ncbi:MAG: T9SS type A sorting domain-containing protein, partial [Bacteroidota bacterium]